MIVEDLRGLVLGGLPRGRAVAARRYGEASSKPPFAVGGIGTPSRTTRHRRRASRPSTDTAEIQTGRLGAGDNGDVVLWASNATPPGAYLEQRQVIREFGELTEVADSRSGLLS